MSIELTSNKLNDTNYLNFGNRVIVIREKSTHFEKLKVVSNFNFHY